MPMSEEARKAASERMKARHAAASERKVEETSRLEDKAAVQATAANAEAYEGFEPTQPAESHDEYQDLLKRFKELEALVKSQQVANVFQVAQVAQATPGSPGSPQMHQGRMVGTFEKYLVDPSNYEDPRDRLGQEPRLQRFAFSYNYFLDWEISTTQYETKDGLNMKEPRFHLKLNRVMTDEDTGELTNNAYTVCQMIFHEDPQAALTIARDQGVDPDSMDQREFLNQMRYLRMKDWLTEAFYPPKSTNTRRKKELVINNKLVEVFEINSEDSQKMPFDQLKTTKGL